MIVLTWGCTPSRTQYDARGLHVIQDRARMVERTTSEHTVLLLSQGEERPAWLDGWWRVAALHPVPVTDMDAVVPAALQARPRAVVVDARGDAAWQDAAL